MLTAAAEGGGDEHVGLRATGREAAGCRTRRGLPPLTLAQLLFEDNFKAIILQLFCAYFLIDSPTTTFQSTGTGHATREVKPVRHSGLDIIINNEFY